jgi:hypothetical protein
MRRHRFSTLRNLPWHRPNRAFVTCHERSSLSRTDREPPGRPSLSSEGRCQEHADDRRSSVRCPSACGALRLTSRTGRSSRPQTRAHDRAYEASNPRRDFMSPSLLADTAIPGRGAEPAHAPLQRRDWAGPSTRDRQIEQARKNPFRHRYALRSSFRAINPAWPAANLSGPYPRRSRTRKPISRSCRVSSDRAISRWR